MSPPSIRNTVSWSPVKVLPYFDGTQLSTATGFFYELAGRTFLVTNYHVVSGINPLTSKTLDPPGRVPDSIAIGLPHEETDEKGRTGIRWQFPLIPLFEEDENGQSIPVWFEHPDFGRKVDVVAIPLGGLDHVMTTTINSNNHDFSKIRLSPSLDAFVVGFPRGMSGGGHFPIWKRATIATEPELDIDDLPKFYVDTATREGMSGSPVIARQVGFWLPEDKTEEKDRIIGSGRRFVGVYSGRIGAEDEFKAQLGIVWKESALLEILASIPPEEEEDE